MKLENKIVIAMLLFCALSCGKQSQTSHQSIKCWSALVRPSVPLAPVRDTLVNDSPADTRYGSYGKDLRYLLYELDSTIEAGNIHDLSLEVILPEKWRAYPSATRRIAVNSEEKEIVRFEMYTWPDTARTGIFQTILYSPEYGSIVVLPYHYSAIALSRILDAAGDTVDLMPLLLQIDRDSVLMPG